MASRAHTSVLIAASLSVIMLISSCAPSSAPARIDHRTVAKRAQPKIHPVRLEKRIHVLINNERRKQGLPITEWDDALAGIARKHSRDMAQRAYFAHSSPEGHDFSYRYRQEGYSCAIRSGNTIYQGAENIALMNLYNSVTTINGEAFYDWNSEEQLAARTVEGWMNSSGHRKNILDQHWGHEGIGIHIAPGNKVYITQNFC